MRRRWGRSSAPSDGSAPAGAFESAAADATRFSAERILKNGPSMDGSESAETSKKCVRNGRSMNGRKMNGRRMNGESMGDSGAMKLVGIELPGTLALRRGR